MKLKTIIGCVLAAAMVFTSTPDLMAQKKSSSSKSSTPSSSSLTKADVNDKEYTGYITLSPDMFLFVRVSINDNDLNMVLQSGVDVNGSWSVSGNTLTSSAGNIKLNLTSSNKGKILQGTTLMNGKKNNIKLYQCPKVSWDKASIKDAIEKGNFYAFVNVLDSEGMAVGCPVTFKYTKDLEDPNSGTFKISGDNKMMTELGVLKGSIKFDDNSLTIYGINNNESSLDYSKADGAIYLTLGKKTVNRDISTIQVLLIKK